LIYDDACLRNQGLCLSLTCNINNVTDHIENVYTKGIILNRPTNLLLSDDDFVNADGSPLEGSSQDNKWKVWFGGEVNGILSDDPEIICLHSLDNEFADQESNVVMKGIKVGVVLITELMTICVFSISLITCDVIPNNSVDITGRGQKDCAEWPCKCK
jgi:hypothetical protein